MTDIVINCCYGGFSLSPKAALLCFERGMKEIATPAMKYFEDRPTDLVIALANWKEYLRCPKQHFSLMLHIFSPDESMVISERPENRSDPILVSVVRDLGPEADGMCAELKVITVPDGIEWEIEEYDGDEWVAEKHRTWR